MKNTLLMILAAFAFIVASSEVKAGFNPDKSWDDLLVSIGKKSGFAARAEGAVTFGIVESVDQFRGTAEQNTKGLKMEKAKMKKAIAKMEEHSIVDYLSKKGIDASAKNRAEIARKNGFTHYNRHATGDESTRQNLALLYKLMENELLASQDQQAESSANVLVNADGNEEVSEMEKAAIKPTVIEMETDAAIDNTLELPSGQEKAEDKLLLYGGRPLTKVERDILEGTASMDTATDQKIVKLKDAKENTNPFLHTAPVVEMPVATPAPAVTPAPTARTESDVDMGSEKPQSEPDVDLNDSSGHRLRNVVVAILAFLAFVSVSAFVLSLRRSRDTNRGQSSREVKTSIPARMINLPFSNEGESPRLRVRGSVTTEKTDQEIKLADDLPPTNQATFDEVTRTASIKRFIKSVVADNKPDISWIRPLGDLSENEKQLIKDAAEAYDGENKDILLQYTQ